MLYSWQNIKRRLEGIKNPVMAEIGVYQGTLSDRLLEHIPGLTLFMVDSWAPNTYTYDKRLHEKFDLQCEKNYQLARKVANTYPNQAFTIRDLSINAANQFHNNFFDLVFIDAGHDYDNIITDIFHWEPKVKKGGWISGHDYPNSHGVVQAVDDIYGSGNIDYIPINERLKMMKRKNVVLEIDSDFCWFVRV